MYYRHWPRLGILGRVRVGHITAATASARDGGRCEPRPGNDSGGVYIATLRPVFGPANELLERAARSFQ